MKAREACVRGMVRVEGGATATFKGLHFGVAAESFKLVNSLLGGRGDPVKGAGPERLGGCPHSVGTPHIELWHRDCSPTSAAIVHRTRCTIALCTVTR